MTCKDCIHHNLCFDNGTLFLRYAKGVDMENVETKCPFKKFKSKSDYAEVKHGKWKEMAEYEHGGIKKLFFVCPLCGRIEYQKEPYCHCGAKMEGGSDT